MYQHRRLYCPASRPIHQLPMGIPVASVPCPCGFFFQGRLVFFALGRLPAVFPRSRIPRLLKTMGHPDPAHSAVPTNTHPIGSGPSPARSCGFFPSPLGFFMLSPASLLSFPLPLSCLPALLFPSHFLLSGRGDPRAQRASAHARTLTCACTHLFHWFIGKGMM
jgi:hypothetical protein